MSTIKDLMGFLRESLYRCIEVSPGDAKHSLVRSSTSFYKEHLNIVEAERSPKSMLKNLLAGPSLFWTLALLFVIPGTAAANVVIAFSPSAPKFGDSVSVSVNVTGTVPMGVTTLSFDGNAVALYGSTASGNTRTYNFYSVKPSTAGIHTFAANFPGDANNAAGSGSQSFTVSKIAAAGFVVRSPIDPVEAAKPSTVYATVTGVIGVAPTGTVTFTDSQFGTFISSLTAGANGYTSNASFTVPSGAVGTRMILPSYSGDSNFSAAGGGPIFLGVVNYHYTTNVSIQANVPTGKPTDIVTLTAFTSGAGGPSSGTITFMDGAAILGTATIVGGCAGSYPCGQASMSIQLAPGTHTIVAAYQNGYYYTTGGLAGTSNPITVVIQGTSDIALTASSNITVYGSAATVFAKLNQTVSGMAGPTGTVTFTDGIGGAILGTVALSGNIASLAIATPLSKGNHSIVASYSGDSHYAAGSSLPLSVAVADGSVSPMTWLYGYDIMNRLNDTVDPNGVQNYAYYDYFGRAIQTQGPAPQGSSVPTIIGYTYNDSDSLTSVADPRNIATTYTPNGLGQVKNQVSPDSGTASFTYDIVGRVSSSIDARGKTTSFTYDDLGRLKTVTYPTGVGTTLQYDGSTNADKGTLVGVTDESGSISYTHDSLGRVIGKTQVTNGRSFAVGYAYGTSGVALGQLTSVTYPSGNQVLYNYDVVGRVSSISVNPVATGGVGQSGAINTLVGNIQYGATGQVVSYVNGAITKTLGFDAYNRIASYSLGNPAGVGNAAGEQRAIGRDSAGRITSYAHTNNGASVPGLDQSFGYDNLGRITSSTLGGVTTQYSYDATGNRTSKTVGGVTYTNSISPSSNRDVTVQDVGGTYSIQYDAAGNVVNDGINSYTYSDRGRMSQVTTAGGSVTYLYNAADQRVYKAGPAAQVPTGAAYFVYAETGALLGEYDATGAPVYETVYAGPAPVGVLKQSGTAAGNNIAVALNYVDSDHLGAPRVITRQVDNAVVWRWDSAEAYGGSAPSMPLGTFTYNQRLPGQVFDAETGLFQNWRREYNPRIGRYMESDPLGLGGGINTYEYVGGSPTMFVDPRGEDSCKLNEGDVWVCTYTQDKTDSGSGQNVSDPDAWLRGNFFSSYKPRGSSLVDTQRGVRYAFMGSPPANKPPVDDPCVLKYLSNNYPDVLGFMATLGNLQQFVPSLNPDVREAYTQGVEVGAEKGLATKGVLSVGTSLVKKFPANQAIAHVLGQGLVTYGSTASGVVEIAGAFMTPFATVAIAQAQSACSYQK